MDKVNTIKVNNTEYLIEDVEAQESITSIQSSFNVLQQAVNALEKADTELQNSINSLETSDTNLNSSVSSLQDSDAELRQLITQLQTSLKNTVNNNFETYDEFLSFLSETDPYTGFFFTAQIEVALALTDNAYNGVMWGIVENQNGTAADYLLMSSIMLTAQNVQSSIYLGRVTIETGELQRLKRIPVTDADVNLTQEVENLQSEVSELNTSLSDISNNRIAYGLDSIGLDTSASYSTILSTMSSNKIVILMMQPSDFRTYISGLSGAWGMVTIFNSSNNQNSRNSFIAITSSTCYVGGYSHTDSALFSTKLY